MPGSRGAAVSGPSELPPKRLTGYSKLAGDVALAVIAGCEHRFRLAKLRTADAFWPSTKPATLSCGRQAGTRALTEQIALELAHEREDAEHKLPRWRGGIDYTASASSKSPAAWDFGRPSARFGRATREQRCWVHKTANVLNKFPKSQQPKAKRALQEIWMAETRNEAEAAFDAFIETYEPKYEKAADCLKKDCGALLAYYDFPAEHWKHLRTTNPIESTFATVRHRTIRSKGCLSNKTALAMVFKLVEGAQKSWRRLDGHNQLPKIIQGVKFTDGLEIAAKLTSQAKFASA
jgi:putative transposase